MKVLILLYVYFWGFTFAQNKAVLTPGGNIQGPTGEIIKVRHTVDNQRGFSKITPYDYSLNGVTGTIDTLGYGDTWGTNFGMFGQDIMLQWFEAPADMDINAVSFTTSDDENAAVSVKLVSMAWDKEQIQWTQDNGASWWGYYEATNWYNDVGAFEEDAHVNGGSWVETGQGEINQWGSPFGTDLWSDFGEGAPASAVVDETTWVEMTLLGFSPQVLAGDLIGVAVKNEGNTMDEGRTGLLANNALGVTGFKMYRNGRLTAGGPGVGDPGWWTRLYTWNIQMAVELTGDRAPVIHNFTQLNTTIGMQDRVIDAVITDDNPGGGPAGVDSALIIYSINNGQSWTIVEMDEINTDQYRGVIPGQAPGIPIDYYIRAVDVAGLSSESFSVHYSIFAPVNPILMVYDDDSFGIETFEAFWLTGLPPDESWTNWGYDKWEAGFGPVSFELLQNYQQVYHVMGVGPVNRPADPGSIYKAWMDQATAENPRNLFLSGQDYGYISGFDDSTFSAGSFEYDYLGVKTLGPQDINYAIQDQNLPYRIKTVENDTLTGWILNEIDTVNNFLAYDPAGMIGFANWIDNLTPSTGIPIFTDPNTGGVIAVRNEGEHWKTTFWPLDPMGLAELKKSDSTLVKNLSNIQNPAAPVFTWFDQPLITGLEKDVKQKPKTFTLRQNYPNPFNPITKISYTLAELSAVYLIVFDALGREVQTLVNKSQTSGAYTIDFDASGLATSGIYYYRLQTSKFVQTRKMVLIR